jgi:hypothetical protein
MFSAMAPRLFLYFKVLITLMALPAIWITYVRVVRPVVFASASIEVQRMESPDQECKLFSSKAIREHLSRPPTRFT